MADKRMFSKKIIDTDAFIEMPISARLLYYDFCMRADDDGFVDSPQKIIDMIGCSRDDLRILITKGYLIPFESRVCVVRHWLIHNTIRRDRYNPTIHLDERNQLELNNKIYILNNEKNTGKPFGNHLATTWQPSIDKNSNSNNNIKVDRPNTDSSGKTIFDYLQEEFGKMLSPMEIEVVETWNYDFDIIKLAIKEPSTNNQRSIKYIDKILYNWKKDGLKTVEEIKLHNENFRNRRQRKKSAIKQNSTDLYDELWF